MTCVHPTSSNYIKCINWLVFLHEVSTHKRHMTLYCFIWRLKVVFPIRWPCVQGLPRIGWTVQWVLCWARRSSPPGARGCRFPHALRGQPGRPRPHVLLLGIVQSLNSSGLSQCPFRLESQNRYWDTLNNIARGYFLISLLLTYYSL